MLKFPCFLISLTATDPEIPNKITSFVDFKTETRLLTVIRFEQSITCRQSVCYQNRSPRNFFCSSLGKTKLDKRVDIMYAHTYSDLYVVPSATT